MLIYFLLFFQGTKTQFLKEIWICLNKTLTPTKFDNCKKVGEYESKPSMYIKRDTTVTECKKKLPIRYYKTIPKDIY